MPPQAPELLGVPGVQREKTSVTGRSMRDIEIEAILSAIAETGSVYKAAAMLKIGTATIYRRMKKYNIELKISSIIVELKRQRKLTFADNGTKKSIGAATGK